jgi:hypothetical protein
MSRTINTARNIKCGIDRSRITDVFYIALYSVYYRHFEATVLLGYSRQFCGVEICSRGSCAQNKTIKLENYYFIISAQDIYICLYFSALYCEMIPHIQNHTLSLCKDLEIMY